MSIAFIPSKAVRYETKSYSLNLTYSLFTVEMLQVFHLLLTSIIVFMFIACSIWTEVPWWKYCSENMKIFVIVYIHYSYCFTENKALGESCEADIQCIGTSNAGVCGKDGKCSCSTGFLQLQQKCVESKLYISE